MLDKISIEPVAECALLIKFDCQQRQLLPLLIGKLTTEFYRRWQPVIMNVTPASTTILIDYLPHRISFNELSQQLRLCIEEFDQQPLAESTESVLRLPVYYGHEVGPDIKRFKHHRVDLDELIERHTQQVYTVEAIGFSPGFAFMSEVHARLQLPRLETPRLMVPKGSVGIAESRTAVYPNSSPGGWNIIGNCPIELYRPDREPMIPFHVGSRVQFYPIERNEFTERGGQLSGEFS